MLATLKARLNCIRAQLVDSTTAEQPETETVEWTNEERVALLAWFFATKWPHLDDGQARELAIRWLIDVQAVGFR